MGFENKHVIVKEKTIVDGVDFGGMHGEIIGWCESEEGMLVTIKFSKEYIKKLDKEYVLKCSDEKIDFSVKTFKEMQVETED